MTKPVIDKTKTWAQLMAESVDDGTMSDLFEAEKVDRRPIRASLTTHWDGQLYKNRVDAFLKALWDKSRDGVMDTLEVGSPSSRPGVAAFGGRVDVEGNLVVDTGSNTQIILDGGGNHSFGFYLNGTAKFDFLYNSGILRLRAFPSATSALAVDSSGNVSMAKALDVTGATTLSSTLTAAEVVPSADITSDLGSSLRRWLHVNAYNIKADGNVTLTRRGATTLASGDNDNVTLPVAVIWRLTPDAAGSAVTGIVAASGRFLVLFNTSSSVSITLKHDTTSTAANRLYCPNSADLVIPPLGSRTAIYDVTIARWLIVGAVA